MPSRHQKQISGYLYKEDIDTFTDTITSIGTSSSRFVREAVLYALNNEQALIKITEACSTTQYRQRSVTTKPKVRKR